MKSNLQDKRLLIVNRGEIAIRIARSARELGMKVIGLWTDNEPDAPHLEYCHEWVHLSGNSNQETYLNIEKILDLIKAYNVDAVHPGYGFLAENAHFCEAVEKMNVRWIGPHSKAIKSMGDKAISKQIAKKANVPVVPGSTGEIDSVDEAIKIANEIGYPVLLKAVAGGGGKGMRTCFDQAEIESAFNAVRREAKSSFGHDGVLVEKFILNPHHIEVQILADKKGNVFHCFERECSVQRRHQKIIEEAPSPFIADDDVLRQNICQTAVMLAKAVAYDSAGTVEFIMGEDKKFYFLEMNTRIQVEHPITEEITGLDLIANMIQSAFDLPLDICAQDQIKLFGHAIECRICAEDPISMLPAPGRILNLDTTFPQGVRFDHCLYQGLNITSDFDPMVGKLIVRGLNRKIAIRKMIEALKGLHLVGAKNNIVLHLAILNEPKFNQGNYSTNYLKEVELEKIIKAYSIEDKLIHSAMALEINQVRL
jgi:acetyl/propionyl-CoA carboxylase alpha subunit